VSAGVDDQEARRLAAALKGLAHPVRLRVLEQAEKGVKLSASKLQATMPEIALGTVSYHVRCLAQAGLLDGAGGAPRRGAIERFYVLSPAGLRMRALLGQMSAALDMAP
jgi:DNA-binding transcriptional ArsR family regulator